MTEVQAPKLASLADARLLPALPGRGTRLAGTSLAPGTSSARAAPPSSASACWWCCSAPASPRRGSPRTTRSNKVTANAWRRRARSTISAPTAWAATSIRAYCGAVAGWSPSRCWRSPSACRSESLTACSPAISAARSIRWRCGSSTDCWRSQACCSIC